MCASDIPLPHFSFLHPTYYPRTTPALPPSNNSHPWLLLGHSSVIRLSLGKLLVNLLKVVKRTITPLIPSQMASWTNIFFWSWVQIPHTWYTITFFFRLSPFRT